MPAVS
jgi:hypothetical protein